MRNINLADEPLSKIAPSVMIPYDGNRTVYEDMRIVGELIGSTAEADRSLPVTKARLPVANREIWQQLHTVHHGRVFDLGHERFSYFDPISIESLLELLTELSPASG